MTVRELRALLRKVPDGMTLEEWNNTKVLMPLNMEAFDGRLVAPCLSETGFGELGVDEDSDETNPAFLIVPHGYFEEKHGVSPELN